jgi:radical SAM protein with 4Fe4S-binding SPASM domain
MQCIHCASSAGAVRPGELKTERMLTLIDELAGMGTEDMVFSGGEPLMHKDWPLLAAKVRDYGMYLGIVSNGTYVMEHADTIEKYTTAFSMSLDGLEETHNYIRQSRDAFRDVMAAFKEMARRNVSRFAITSISKLNLHQIEDIYKLLLEYEVVGWQVQLTFASGRMRDHARQVCDPGDLRYIIDFLTYVRQDDRVELHTGDNIGYYTAHEELMRGYRWGGCQAGISALSVEADGTVKGCLCQNPEFLEGKDFVEGNINTRSIKDIWQDDRLFSYNRNFDFSKVEGFCRGCMYLSECRCGCSAFAYYVTGTKYDNPYCLYRLMSTE